MDGKGEGVDVEVSQFPTEFLNSHLTDGVTSLGVCKELHTSLSVKKSKLCQKKESPAGSSNNSSDGEDKSAFEDKNVEEEVKRIELLLRDLQSDLDDHLRETVETLDPLEKLTSKICDTDKCNSYLQCVSQIEDISHNLQSTLWNEEVALALDYYEKLAEVYEKLQRSRCSHLIGFIEGTIRHWHNVIKEKLSSELAGVIKTMHWPVVTVVSTAKSKTSTLENTPLVISQLTHIFKQLLTIQLPKSINSDETLHPIIASTPNYKSPVLPMSLLVEPLKKRFRYHFYGSKQTNSLEKPEWFYTQLLTWAKDHSEYLTTVIQPALWEAGYDFVDANVEFLRCLHMIAGEKLISCIPDMMYDEYLFSHLIHETLSFHNDMCRIHDYPSDEPSCIAILTAEDPFKRWINIEKKFAQEAMDSMTESTTAWVCHYKSSLDDSDGDQNKVAECAESFVTLLYAITDRYRPLPYAVCQLMFVSMKKELLEDYRIRLVQIRKEYSPNSTQYCAILNTTHYLLKVLSEWKEQPFFLRLQYEESQLRAKSSYPLVLSSLLSRNASYKLAVPLDLSAVQDLECSLFDTSLTNITSLEGDMLNNMTYHVITELKAQLRTYADNNNSMWVGLNHLKHAEEQRQMSLSSALCPLVIYLQDSLLTSKEHLHRHLFTRYWQQIVLQLDGLIFDMVDTSGEETRRLLVCGSRVYLSSFPPWVVSGNYFSEGGAIQFNFDMTRNLFPIIGKYTSKPDNFLKMVKESCYLLTLKLGDALLLKGTLYEALHTLQSSQIQDPIATVHEQGIFKLTPEQTELVLSRRNDLLRT